MSSKKDEAREITPSQLQKEQQQAVNKALDQTRDDIRKSVNEAKREIPRYTEAVNEYQEQTMEAAREIADNYIESQKEILNSFQSVWSPFVENYTRNVNTVVHPGRVSEVYANAVRSYADNLVTVTRLANNVIFGNVEAFSTSLQQAKDNAKELSRIAVNTARTFEQTSRETARLTPQ
jgi:2',3'-cyclic-nucleotide 2'-phosphodiesterase (5'-nucleotidase family)